MNQAKLDELIAEANASVSEMIGEFPGTCEDDVAHDTLEGVCLMHEVESPEEVDELWRINFGETWSERKRAIAEVRNRVLTSNEAQAMFAATDEARTNREWMERWS